MIIRIKYNKNGNDVIESLDDSVIDIPQYCRNLISENICDQIFVETNGEFVLAGV